MLKWRTPLEQVLDSDCLSVTRNGHKIPYDGILIKRNTPGPDQFLLVKAGQTVSSTFDVSEGYEMIKAGTYSVAVDTYIEYAEGSVEGMNEPGKPGIPIKMSHLSSPPVRFQVVGREVGKGTQGYRARSIERGNRRTISVRSSVARDPIVHGNAAQVAETKQIHHATYPVTVSAISDVQTETNHYNTWFGRNTYLYYVKETYELMERYMREDVITYVHGGGSCSSGTYAYTWRGSRTIHLCQEYENSPSFTGVESKVGVLVHELSHALAWIEDIGYGVSFCKSLAISYPNKAAVNADNYQYFITTK